MLKGKFYLNYRKDILIFFSLSILSVLSMFFLDTKITDFIHDNQTKYKTIVEIFDIINIFGKGITLLLIFLFFAIFFWIFSYTNKNRVRFLLVANRCLFIFFALITSGIIVNIFKFIFSRYRPSAYIKNGSYGFNPFTLTDGSFPSGHSTSIATAMVALMIFLPKYKIIWGFIILIVMLARIITEYHFLSDVVMGTYLGSVTTVYLLSYAKKYLEI